MFNMKYQLIAAAALAAASVSVQAASINSSLSNYFGTIATIGFESFDGLVTSTEALGNGVTFAADSNAELSPATRDLGTNGLWTIFGLDGFAASGTSGVMTFSFDSLTNGTGAFISHLGGASVLVEAVGTGGSVLESYSLSFAAPSGIDGYDEGTYVGFARSSADIQSLRLSGVGLVADNITVAVPEPSSYALALCGLGMVAAVMRRRTQG
jgi:hypothetical protein